MVAFCPCEWKAVGSKLICWGFITFVPGMIRLNCWILNFYSGVYRVGRSQNPGNVKGNVNEIELQLLCSLNWSHVFHFTITGTRLRDLNHWVNNNNNKNIVAYFSYINHDTTVILEISNYWISNLLVLQECLGNQKDIHFQFLYWIRWMYSLNFVKNSFNKYIS